MSLIARLNDANKYSMAQRSEYWNIFRIQRGVVFTPINIENAPEVVECKSQERASQLSLS